MSFNHYMEKEEYKGRGRGRLRDVVHPQHEGGGMIKVGRRWSKYYDKGLDRGRDRGRLRDVVEPLHGDGGMIKVGSRSSVRYCSTTI